MPIRFRKTFRILPGVKINFSRGGISTTLGSRGFHLTFNKNGVRQSVGIPGSGLSESSYLIKNESDSSSQPKHDPQDRSGEVGCFPWGCLLFIVIGVIVTYLGASALGLVPPNYLSHLLQQVGL
jgi:Protein of unknown function (DUF4236)